MKTYDVAIVGGGIMGLSLALGLRKHGAEVVVIDKSEPGREASSAAAGMIAHCDQHTHELLRPLAVASAALYPEFVHEIEDESGIRADLRREGAILFLSGEEEFPLLEGMRRLDSTEIHRLEPRLSPPLDEAVFAPELSVDPRALTAGCIKAAHHRGIHVVSGSAVSEVEVTKLGVAAVCTERTRYPARKVVNCAGAWAGQVGPHKFPTWPVKGQILCVLSTAVKHVVRLPGFVYLVPRSDGRMLIGSTMEEAGFDKRVTTDVIQKLHQAAANLVPDIGEARMLETWAGLRPGTPDSLPILGETATPGYFVCTGHFRDGILLAPITTQIMTKLVRGEDHGWDLAPFSPGRFVSGTLSC